ncbi:MAG: phage tail protein [Stellaceae bacterium]
MPDGGDFPGGKGGGPQPFSNAFHPPTISSLRYNTSQAGSPVPICYGTHRLSVNLAEFWGQQGFSTSSSKGGKGLGQSGGKKGSGANFSVNVAFGLCQGPSNFTGSALGFDGYNRVWSNGAVSFFNDVALNGYAGNDGQSPDPVFASSDTNVPVLGYSGTSYVTGTPIQLGSSPALPNISFEITGFEAGTVGSIYPGDANPASIVTDILTNSRYGAGFPAANLDSAGSIADFGLYCQANQLAMSLVLDRQQPCARWVEEIAQLTVAAVVWSGSLLKIIPYSETALTFNGATWTPDLTAQYSLTDSDFLDFGGGSDPVMVTRSDPAAATNWLSIEYMDAVNSYNPQILPVWDQGLIDQYGLRSEPAVQAHGFTNPTPAIVSAGLQLARKAYNRNTYKWKLGWRYSLLEPMDIVELTEATLGLVGTPLRIIQIDEDDNGELTVTAEELIGLTAAVHLRQTSAGTPLDFLVDPGNTNSPILFEPPAALSGGLEVWMIASGGAETAATNAATPSGDILHFAGPLPAAIVPGVTVEDLTHTAVIPAATTVVGVTPTSVTLSANVTGAGVSSGDTIGFFNANWGGCQVWVSSDGSSYSLFGTIYRGARQGVLSASLPSHADPDTVDTLSVDLHESQGRLLSGTLADADNLVTLCYCDGELVSYETATLTAAYKYDLTYLRRGAYGTPISSHSSGSNFARFGPNDPSLFRYSYPSSFIGQTIYVKLPAFNTFGQMLQSLAGVTANTYTLTGAGAVTPSNVPIQFLGIPQNGAPVSRYTFGESVNLPSGLTASVCTAGTAATASTTFNIAKNGTNIGTMNFAATATSATFAMASSHSFIAGDVLTITPTRTDATLADLSGLLVGTSG